jgi:methyl-accepting chemotaxis protein-1 (serine sensor receptor)
VVGALGLTALNRASQSLDGLRAAIWWRFMHSTMHRRYLLRSRVAIDRFNTLQGAGNADEAKKALGRAQELLGKGNESWQAYLDAPKSGIDQALLDDVLARRTTVMHDGVEPEFAALHANDMPLTTRLPIRRSARCSSPTTIRRRRSSRRCSRARRSAGERAVERR